MRGAASTVDSLGLAFGEHVELVVRGDCMPGIDDGSRICATRKRMYVVGDVVVVRRRAHWNVHRFIGYAWSPRGWLALTQADDSEVHDPPVPARQIVGRVDARVTLRERLRAAGRFVAACRRQMAR